MREIVLDTETTGLDPLRGDRLVEVGCIEIYNRMPTGQTFHRYINPERDVPAEAFNVHGLSTEFLASKPLFAEVVEEFLEFIADAPLVIHNASFDISFINAELDRIKRPAILRERLVDTLLLARRKHPGVSNRLDRDGKIDYRNAVRGSRCPRLRRRCRGSQIIRGGGGAGHRGGISRDDLGRQGGSQEAFGARGS